MVCVASAPQGIAFAGIALPCLETWRGRVLKDLNTLAATPGHRYVKPRLSRTPDT